MLAKVLPAEWAAPEADVAVTKPVRTAVLLCTMAVLVAGYQNCSVTLSGETPGASTFVCAPTTSQLATFEQLESSIFATTTPSTSCGYCHTPDGPSPTGAGQFTMLTNNAPKNPALTAANYCTIANRGNEGMSVIFTDFGHGGGKYDKANYQNLVDFFESL